jgi:hypothetical protein
MTRPIDAFFAQLARQPRVFWLGHERGRLRFELVDGDRVVVWTVSFDDGRVAVCGDEREADGVLRVERGLFERAVRGADNLVAAELRGEVGFWGSRELLVQFGRLLPGPPDQRGPRRVAGRVRRAG